MTFASEPRLGRFTGRGPRFYPPQDWRVANGKEFAVLSGCGNAGRIACQAHLLEWAWRGSCALVTVLARAKVDRAACVDSMGLSGVQDAVVEVEAEGGR